MENGNIVDVHCIYCNEKVGNCEREYIEEYPNSSDVWIEQLSRQHQCREELTWECEYCGEVYYSCDPAYWEEYPNGSSLAISQARERHQESCSCLWHEQDSDLVAVEEQRQDIERRPRKARRP